jgi:hypothetical protein
MSDPTAKLSGVASLPIEDTRIQPDGIASRVNLFCHIRKTPMVLTALFTEILRAFYSDTDNQVIDVCKQWTDDPATNQIWIGTAWEYQDRTPELRPAIYVRLAPIAYRSASGQPDALTGMELATAEYYFERIAETSVDLVVVGSTAGETSAVVGSTLDFMDAMGFVIRRDYGFKSVELVQAGAGDGIKSESRDNLVGHVRLKLVFTDSFTLKLESPTLKRLSLVIADSVGKLM